jgi:DNA replication ATP-dependent helicase Dna2
MNVSFTRARCKLVIVGSRKTLQREPLLAQFFDLMESQGWILALPTGADVAHARVFEGCSTPAKRRTGKENRVAVKRMKPGHKY